MYHPIQHIKEDWSKSSGIFGKIAVILFYTLVWLGVLSLCVLFVNPASQDVDCAFAGFDDYTQGCFKIMTRMACPLLVLFFLYLEQQGVHRGHVGSVLAQAVAVSISILGIHHTKIPQDDQNRITPECSKYLMEQNIAYLVWAWLIVVFVLLDRFQKSRSSSTSPEEASQPLLNARSQEYGRALN